MNIVYSSSEFYFKPTLVSTYSLLKNSNCKHEIYLLSSQISKKNKSLFCNLVTSMGSIAHVLEIDHILEKKAVEFNLPLMRNNYSTYTRLFLSEILDIESALLIDSDTLILGEIENIKSELNNTSAIFAARDYVISNKYSRHEDPNLSNKNYFNMGIIYINLMKWREYKLTAHIKQNFDKEYNLKIADQTIVNKYLHNYISEINIKFNWYTYFRYDFDYDFYLSQHNQTSFISKVDFKHAKDYPVVIHYIGTWFERPWFRKNICLDREIYYKYWDELFSKFDLYPSPSFKFSTLYNYISIWIFKFLGLKTYYNFRYIIIQKIKRFL